MAASLFTGGCSDDDSGGGTTVRPGAPEIVTHPSNASVKRGTQVTFSVVANGSGLSYQWESSTDDGDTWHTVPNATAADHVVAGLPTAEGWLYRCVVSNSGGTATSKTACYSLVEVIFVNPAATGSDDGTSWDNAYTSLQSALGSAGQGDEIWVAAGTYLPHATDAAVSFNMIEGVDLYGGFTGFEFAREARDWSTNETILSGDIGTTGDASDNSYHVVVGASARLDGFTVIAGNARGTSPDNFGGGMYNEDVAPVVANCWFKQNHAINDGGAMLNTGGSVMIEDCTFSDNTAGILGAALRAYQCRLDVTGCLFTDNAAVHDGGGVSGYGAVGRIADSAFNGNSGVQGGAMCLEHDSYVAVVDCSFTRNIATVEGGAVYSDNRTVVEVTDCEFQGNTAPTGGAIYSLHTLRLTGSMLCGNLSTADGAGAYVSGDGQREIINCTFSANQADGNGGAIYYAGTHTTDIINCVLWGNTAGTDSELAVESGTPTVASTCIEGGYTGVGNIGDGSGDDPLFVQIPNAGADATWGTDDDDYGDLRLSANSPCIDAGDNASVPPISLTDLDGKPRIVDGDGMDTDALGDGPAEVDMGAYELQ
jgi:predicted outer membrane repeat protein